MGITLILPSYRARTMWNTKSMRVPHRLGRKASRFHSLDESGCKSRQRHSVPITQVYNTTYYTEHVYTSPLDTCIEMYTPVEGFIHVNIGASGKFSPIYTVYWRRRQILANIHVLYIFALREYTRVQYWYTVRSYSNAHAHARRRRVNFIGTAP